MNLSWSVPGGCSCLASVTIKGVYKGPPIPVFFRKILPSYAYILGGFKAWHFTGASGKACEGEPEEEGECRGPLF